MYGSGLSAVQHEARPSLLASRGFATLSLEFVNGEFTDDIHLETFERGINFLLNHDCVRSEKGIGIYAISKGGSMALASAAFLQGIKCVIAINCSLFSDHTTIRYKGHILPSYHFDKTRFREDDELKETFEMHKCFKTPVDPEADSKMKSLIFEFYKKKDIAFMYSASLDDGNVPSPYYADQVEKLLKQYKHPCYEVVRYEGAGHLLEPPYTPLCQASYTPLINAVLLWGGNPVKHYKAQVKSWNKHLAFLKTHLC